MPSYDFTQREKYWLKFWEKENIYKFNSALKKPIFSVDTPPPTVSGKMHLGHAFSYTQQDIIVRYRRMKGENVLYPFGTDDNGLPTERLVEKENQVKIFRMKRNDFIKLCQETLKKIRPVFIQDWKDMGISADFGLIYSTINSDVQKISQSFFIDLYNKKRVYRKQAPTIWCPQCQTAIAQAELEDKELESVFYDLIFKLEGGKQIIIATTRPELLSSCVAIFIHPQDKRYADLVGKFAIVPIFGQKVEIKTDERVDISKGTGMVMCCTFGDRTDIEWYLGHNLPLKISINKDGVMNESAGFYKGLKIKEARQRIAEDLKKQGIILQQKNIKHIVNVHERCGTEIEIINTAQWFIRYLDLKDEFLKIGREINWFPAHMRGRYENWIKGLQWDWCVSRQRYFGIPFPLWYCRKCGEVILAKAEDLPVDPLNSSPKQKCLCGGDEFIGEADVLDTWATSALTPQIVQSLIKRDNVKKKIFPMSLRPQAHDIINFWLFYTVARSKIHFDDKPWKDVMISGFILDPKGEKMSKSKGNVIAPQEVVKKYSVDVFRYWTAKANLGEDLCYSEKEIENGKRTIIKIWNASRFCLTHLQGFRTEKKFDFKKLEDEDRWILHILEETLEEYCRHLDVYEFKKARDCADRFFWHNFCDNYLEIVKPRLYEEKFGDFSKEAAKFALYKCLLLIIKLYAPFIPFITEEIFQSYFREREGEKSIHLSAFPETDKKFLNKKIKENFDSMVDIISSVRKYKTGRGESLKKEINKLLVETKNRKIENYFELLKSVMNIKSVEMKEGLKKAIAVSDSVKIKIEE